MRDYEGVFMENKTYEEIWNEIEKTLEDMGLTIFNISKIYLPSEKYKIYHSHMIMIGERMYWCGKPVVEYFGKVIYFKLV